LIDEAIRIREAVQDGHDLAARQLQDDLADRIDQYWLAHDFTGLAEAVGKLVRLFDKAPPPPDACAIDSIDLRPLTEDKCPGCDVCRATGKEPEPTAHERLDVVWLRIAGKPWPYGSLSCQEIPATSFGETNLPGATATFDRTSPDSKVSTAPF
jgi:hypothetical protein